MFDHVYGACLADSLNIGLTGIPISLNSTFLWPR